VSRARHSPRLDPIRFSWGSLSRWRRRESNPPLGASGESDPTRSNFQARHTQSGLGGTLWVPIDEAVRDPLATFREVGRGLPRYVERDFTRYLECGVLAHGFARVRCESCMDELLVAFSCKGRGMCPS
jgi:hypothetical protein